MMITIEKTETLGWEAALRGMRNPKNSWSSSDSSFSGFTGHDVVPELKIGPNDLKLASLLANAGTDHGKFLRMIAVYADITAPLYWWKEYDTYKVGTVANSCSTMHKIHAKEFTVEDFSHEHLGQVSMTSLQNTVNFLNTRREGFLETGDKKYWYEMIQLLPSSYNQKRTVELNYQVLKNIYFARRNHKLDEWHSFCDWICSLPYAGELITAGAKENPV